MAYHSAEAPAAARHRNLNDGERLACIAAGALLAVGGLKRRSLLGLLGAGAGALLLTRGVTGHSALYERLDLDSTASTVAVRAAITVNRPVEEVYRFWRDLRNLPRFMRHLHTVTLDDSGRSHWVAKAPVTGASIEWDAEIVEERQDEWIHWRSVSGSRIVSEGSVAFRRAPAGRGTEVHVNLHYRPPAGVALAQLLGPVTAKMLKREIQALRPLLETGEIPTTEGQPSARAQRAA